MSDLLKIFDKHKTDKGSDKHFYNEIYEPHFEQVRYDSINILEIGVFKGASTAALHEYFPNATIYGLDIFVRVDAKDIAILNEKRVKYLKADSLDPSSQALIEKTWPDVKFDIIIDDGAHWPEANQFTFRHTFPLLKETGKYFAEDIWPFDIMTAKELNDPWLVREQYSPQAYTKFLDEIGTHTLYDHRRKPNGKFIGDSAIIMVEK